MDIEQKFEKEGYSENLEVASHGVQRQLAETFDCQRVPFDSSQPVYMIAAMPLAKLDAAMASVMAQVAAARESLVASKGDMPGPVMFHVGTQPQVRGRQGKKGMEIGIYLRGTWA